MNRRMLLKTAVIAVAGVAAPRIARAAPRLRVTRHRIPWPELSRPIRFVQLTDIHVGWTTPREILEAAATVAVKMKPAFVALTGDYVNHSLKHVDRLTELVAALPKPVFATLGNHDHWSGPDGVTRALAAGGATVLVNESVMFEKNGMSLPIVGIDDGRTGNDRVSRAFEKIGAKARPLVLTHYPNTADKIVDAGGHLVIAGHTHGGQMSIPGVTRFFSRMAGQRYLAGWYEVGDSQLYVSAGVGASLDGLRGGRAAVPEVAIYDLVPISADRDRRASYSASFDGRRFRRFRPDERRYDDVLRAVSDDL